MSTPTKADLHSFLKVIEYLNKSNTQQDKLVIEYDDPCFVVNGRKDMFIYVHDDLNMYDEETLNQTLNEINNFGEQLQKPEEVVVEEIK